MPAADAVAPFSVYVLNCPSVTNCSALSVLGRRPFAAAVVICVVTEAAAVPLLSAAAAEAGCEEGEGTDGSEREQPHRETEKAQRSAAQRTFFMVIHPFHRLLSRAAAGQTE